MKAQVILKRIETYFDNKVMYQILLKVNNHTELTRKEKEELDNWVVAYKYRDVLFKQLQATLELQIEVGIATKDKLKDLQEKVKEMAPINGIDLSGSLTEAEFRSSVLLGLKSYSSNLVLKLIRRHMWGAILFVAIALLLIGGLVCLAIRFH